MLNILLRKRTLPCLCVLAGITAVLAATIIVKTVDLDRFDNTTPIFKTEKIPGTILEKKNKSLNHSVEK